MSGHKRGHRSRNEGYGRGEFAGRGFSDISAGRPAPTTLKPMVWIAVLIGLAVWSLAAWIGYVSVDGLLGWATANAGTAVDSGKKLVTAVGVGKEQVGVIDSLNVSGLLVQAITLLKMIAKPAIVVIWAIGAFALLAAPVLLRRIDRLARRH